MGGKKLFMQYNMTLVSTNYDVAEFEFQVGFEPYKDCA